MKEGTILNLKAIFKRKRKRSLDAEKETEDLEVNGMNKGPWTQTEELLKRCQFMEKDRGLLLLKILGHAAVSKFAHLLSVLFPNDTKHLHCPMN